MPAFAQDAQETHYAQDAQGGIEEIVVTAQKREQRLQDVPVSITAITGTALESARVMNVRDIAGLAPNLQVREQPGGGAQPSFTMRGLINLGTTAGADKGIAVYVDGVFLGGTQASVFELPDLERVEVLRGPQGTLFGRNATGGAISFVSADPSRDKSLKHRVSVGNLGTLRTSTTLQTGEIGPFTAMFNYTHSEQDGDIRNLGAGTRWDFTPAYNGKPTFFTSPKKLGGYNLEAFTAKVKFQPSSDFWTTYRFDYTEQVFSGSGFGLLYESPTLRSVRASQPNPANLTPVGPNRPDAVNNWETVPSDMKVWGHTVISQWRVSDAISVKNILSLRKAEYLGAFSGFTGEGGLINTNTPAVQGLLCSPLLGAARPACLTNVANATVGAPLLVNATTSGGSDKQFSDELQVNYDSDFVTLTTGAIYFRNRNKKWTAGEDGGLGRARSGAFRVYPGFAVPFAGQPGGGGGRPTSILIKSTAVYSQAEFHVTPELDLIGGIRYTWDRKTGIDNSIVALNNPTGLVVDYKDSRATYNIGANYKINPDVMVYAKYSTGFISGGALGSLTYDPETAKSLEGGIKADWFDRMLRTNLSVFYVKYGNLQQAVQGNNLTPAQPLISQAIVNAGRAKAAGFELETTFAPTRELLFTGNVGYTDFKFKDLPEVLTRGNDVFHPSFRAKWTANVAAQYSTPVGNDDAQLLARVDGSWKSRQYGFSGLPSVSASFSAAEQAAFAEAGMIDPYWLVNARVGIDNFNLGGAKAGIALWSKNLFDNRSPYFTQALSSLLIASSFERARTYGIDLSIEF